MLFDKKFLTLFLLMALASKAIKREGNNFTSVKSSRTNALVTRFDFKRGGLMYLFTFPCQKYSFLKYFRIWNWHQVDYFEVLQSAEVTNRLDSLKSSNLTRCSIGDIVDYLTVYCTKMAKSALLTLPRCLWRKLKVPVRTLRNYIRGIKTNNHTFASKNLVYRFFNKKWV